MEDSNMCYQGTPTGQQIQEALFPEIINYTLPIVQNSLDEYGNLQVKLDRSGVFLRIAQEHFILTAAHKLKERIEKVILLCVALEQDPHFLPLDSCEYHGTEIESRDVAIIKLDSDTVKQLILSHSPLSLTHIDRSIPEQEITKQKSFYLTAGYPQEWFSQDDYGFNIVPLSFLGGPHKGEVEEIAKMTYDSRIHGVYEFNREAIRYSDSLTALLPLYNGMQGISGCGIWRIYHDDAATGAFPNSYRLTAIQHRYHHSKNYVHGTKIAIVMQRLLFAYPELRNAFEIQYPHF